MPSSPRQIRHQSVAMSLEAIAGAWARTEAAPAGSVVIADEEIAGRVRGGTPWHGSAHDSYRLAMITRPTVAPPAGEALWLAASLAGARAAADVSGRAITLTWPDEVVAEGRSRPALTVNVTLQLGPGRIEHALVSLRCRFESLGIDPSIRSDLEHALIAHVEAAVGQLESDPTDLVAEYTDRSSLIGRRVKATLLPRGEARGTVAAFDGEGRLVLTSSTGMLEKVTPTGIRSLELI